MYHVGTPVGSKSHTATFVVCLRSCFHSYEQWRNSRFYNTIQQKRKCNLCCNLKETLCRLYNVNSSISVFLLNPSTLKKISNSLIWWWNTNFSNSEVHKFNRTTQVENDEMLIRPRSTPCYSMTLLKVSVSQKNAARANKPPFSTLPGRYSIYMVNPAASAIPLKYFDPEYTMKVGYPRD